DVHVTGVQTCALPISAGGESDVASVDLRSVTDGCRVNGVVGLCVGTPGKDRIVGTPGDDVIFGDGGNDGLYGEGGDDHLYGGTRSEERRGGRECGAGR